MIFAPISRKVLAIGRFPLIQKGEPSTVAVIHAYHHLGTPLMNMIEVDLPSEENVVKGGRDKERNVSKDQGRLYHICLFLSTKQFRGGSSPNLFKHA